MPAFIAAGYDWFPWFAQMETGLGEEAGVTDAGLFLAILGHSEGSGDEPSVHAIGIERARAVTIVGQATDSLPIARPVVQDRIRFVE